MRAAQYQLLNYEMSVDRDQARLIAERVARRVAGNSSPPTAHPQNGAPVHEELSAIRSGLHDLERKLDQLESKIVPGSAASDSPSARVIDFVSARSPAAARESTAASPTNTAQARGQEFVPATQSPWLAPMSNMYDDKAPSGNPQSAIRSQQSPSHPSEERFGIEEAAVSELVEFFENEKKCSVDPSGKPCDHCAMCSSRGF
jgi:hypothetical protein